MVVMKEIHNVKDLITEKIKHVKTDDEAEVDDKAEDTNRRRRRENRVFTLNEVKVSN